MTDSHLSSKGKLADVFAKINMSELPAMSAHVQELLALTSDKRSANYDDLARIILKDFSLTHKVLQFANSAYYALGQKVSTVSMAVAVLGFDTVRDLALGIALFDDFIQAGVNTEEISELLGRSFLAALLARSIAESRYLKVLPEEAFICGLMRNLGKIIACIYLPVIYSSIKNETAKGVSEDEAAMSLLDGLTYAGVGREVAIFWNMTESVIRCMEPDPPVPESDHDVEKYLHSIVDFSNRYVDCLWFQHSIEPLTEKYGYPLSLDEQEAVEMLIVATQASETIFDSIRPGILKFDFRKRLEEIQARSALEASFVRGKSVDDFWRETQEMVKGPFRLNDFFPLLLDAFCFGVGVDRAVFAMLQSRGEGKVLIGQLGRGDITPDQLKKFQVAFSRTTPNLVQKSLTMCKDIALAADKVEALPDELQFLVAYRTVYLFPVCLKEKGIALLYLDRSQEKPRLASDQVQQVRRFRDFAQQAIEMKSKKE
ncbi:MAG: HDOD domain-containing protein [Desulfurivibrio sp.]|nr:MAG: HDOD domain-containing protein [Desulfurivibrio sp.]